jgi:HAE1 family hydrophobic/amphiphilic exporter-1
MGKLALGFESLFNKFSTYYEIALRWGLHHRRTVYATAISLIILAVSLIPLGLIGVEFIASGDKGEFMIELEGEPQNTLYQTNMLTRKVENILLKKPEVIKVFSNIGYSSSSGLTGTGSSQQNKSEITVTLVPKQKRKQSVEKYAAMIKNEISNIPGLKVTSTPVSISGGTMESAIQILLRGPEIEKLYKVADSVMLIMKDVQGTSDIKLSVEKSKPEMQIALNRDKMAILGLSVNDVGSTLRLAFAGNTDMQYSEGGVDYSINLKFDRFDRKKVEDIGSLTFLNGQGKMIELRDFADISQSLSPNKLERYDRISSLTVNASVFGRPVGTVGQEIKDAIGKRFNAQDISIEFTGQMQRQNEAFGSLGIAILAALILVYLIMVVLYNSYIHPFIVFFSIPVAVIGALFALALTRQTLSIFTIIGLIMLIGLVTKNAILLVDFTNQLREKGHGVFDALVEAGKVRLRPILMTTLSMVSGMLPIALASAEGAEVKNGMAWVIIGGLGSSLLLTLILVPAVYMSVDLFKAKAGRLFAKKAVVIPKISNG